MQDAGLKQYQRQVTSTLSKVKNQIQAVTTMLGAALALDFGAQAVSAFGEAVAAAGNLEIQLGQILERGTDVVAVTNRLFEIAQETGETYGDVGERFKSMSLAAKEAGVSTQVTLDAMWNIGQALEVGRQEGEQVGQAFERIQRAMRRGKLDTRSFGELLHSAPIVMRTLGQALGKTEAQLREMAETGKLTSDIMLRGLAKKNTLLDAEMAQKAITLGEAFTYIYNTLVRVGVAFWKNAGGVKYLANAIIWVTDTIVEFGQVIVDSLGGAENTIMLLKIAMSLVFSYFMIKMIASLTVALWSLAPAAIAAAAPWLLIAAGVAALALAIQDLMVWMEGGDSLLGRWLGPWEEFRVKIEGVIAPLREIGKLFTDTFGRIMQLDFTTWAGWVGLLKEINGLFAGLGDIALNVLGNLVKGTPLEPLVNGLRAVANTLGLVTDAIFKLLGGDFSGAFASMQAAVASISFEGIKNGIASIVAGFRDLRDQGLSALKDLAAGTIFEPMIGAVQTLLSIVDPLVDAFFKLVTLDFAGAGASLSEAWTAIVGVLDIVWQKIDSIFGITDKIKVAVTAVKDAFQWLSELTFGALETALKKIGGILESMANAARWVGSLVGIGDGEKPTGKPSTEAPANAVVPPTPTAPETNKEPGWWGRNMPTFMGGAESVVPTVSPGAMAPTTQNNKQEVNNNVPITNNVTVTVPAEFSELQNTINTAVANATTKMAEDTARQLTRAAPAMEARAGG